MDKTKLKIQIVLPIFLFLFLATLSISFGASSSVINSPLNSTITYGTGINPNVTINGNTSTWTVKLYLNGAVVLTNTSVANHTAIVLIKNFLLPGGSDNLIAQATAPGGVKFNSTVKLVTVNKANITYSFPLPSPESVSSFSLPFTITAPSGATISVKSDMGVLPGFSVSASSSNVVSLSVPYSGIFSFTVSYAGNQNYSSFSKVFSMEVSLPSPPFSSGPPPPPSSTSTPSSAPTDIVSSIIGFFASIGHAIASFFAGI